MQYPLRVLETEDYGENLDWVRYASHDGCPTRINTETPTVVSLCLEHQTDIEDYTTQILNIIHLEGALEDIEDGEYNHFTWDWYNQPDPNLLNLRDSLLQNIPPQAKKPLIDELIVMVDALRAQYNLPVYAGEIPPEWVSGQVLEGGTLVRVGYRYYWSRIDLTAEENTRSPATEEANNSLVRFRLFNQGIPDFPASNITIDRKIVLEQPDMGANKVFKYQGEIVPEVELKFFDFVPGFEIDALDVGDRFSVSNSSYRLIARVIDIRDVLIVIDDTTEPPTVLPDAKRLTWDPEWDAGDWIEDQIVQMRFFVRKK